jgi:hypothetical protein
MKYNVDIITIPDQTFLKEWDKLWKESSYAHIFNAPEWFLMYQKIYKKRQYQIITLREKTELVAVFPLVKEKKTGIKTYQNPGGKYLDRSTLLIKELDEELLKVLLVSLKKLGNINLSEMPEEIAKKISQLDKDFSIRVASINPYLIIDDDPLRHPSSSIKKDIANTLAKHPQLEFHSFSGDNESLKKAIAIDRKSAKMKQGKATFVNNSERLFFNTLLETYKKDFIVDIISLDGTPFVYSIGIRYKNIFHGINTSYDEAYKQLQPGKLLFHFIINNLQKEKIHVYDFSRGTSPLKREFAPLAVTQYDLFYAKQGWIKSWWSLTDRLMTYLLANKLFYNNYCKIKKLFYS